MDLLPIPAPGQQRYDCGNSESHEKFFWDRKAVLFKESDIAKRNSQSELQYAPRERVHPPFYSLNSHFVIFTDQSKQLEIL